MSTSLTTLNRPGRPSFAASSKRIGAAGRCVALLHQPHHGGRAPPQRQPVSTRVAVGGPQGSQAGAPAVQPPQAQQQQQPDQQQQPHSSSWYKSHFDMNLWHYLPWWLQPAPILVSGMLFFAAALVLDNEEPTLKAAVIAAGPVALYYAICLFVLPSQFSKFAVSYMRKHPELEEQALSPQGSQDRSE